MKIVLAIFYCDSHDATILLALCCTAVIAMVSVRSQPCMSKQWDALVTKH